MDQLARNEQLKLLANALDSLSTAFVTIGILAPVAASIYGMGSTVAPALSILAISGFVWLLCAVVLHLGARYALRGLRS